MTIREYLRDRKYALSTEIHEIKKKYGPNFYKPSAEDYSRYLSLKKDVSLLLTATRILKCFPEEIKYLIVGFPPEYLKNLHFEQKRFFVRQRIEDAASRVKPHCHRKQARKMIRRALKFIRQEVSLEFRDVNPEELFREKREFAPQA